MNHHTQGIARDWFYRGVTPAADLLAACGVRPNQLTLAGLTFSVAAGILYGTGRPVLAGLFLAAGGLCDALDGLVARRTGREQHWGAFLDSTLDRVGESAVMIGLAVNSMLPSPGQPIVAGIWITALAASLWVSYTKARAEALGVECNVGWMQRPERLLLIIAASWLTILPTVGTWTLPGAGFLIAALSIVTTLQRIRHVRQAMHRRD